MNDVVALPPRVEDFVREVLRDRLNGSVTLHFVAGEIRSWELRETGRDTARLTGERVPP